MMASRSSLRMVLLVFVMVMVGSGVATALFGTTIVPRGASSPGVDSELRFYGVWYAVAGVMLFRSLRRPTADAFTVRLVAGAFFVAGCSCVVSWIVEGRPHGWFVFLLVVELVIPFVLIPWQAAVARTGGREASIVDQL